MSDSSVAQNLRAVTISNVRFEPKKCKKNSGHRKSQVRHDKSFHAGRGKILEADHLGD